MVDHGKVRRYPYVEAVVAETIRRIQRHELRAEWL